MIAGDSKYLDFFARHYLFYVLTKRAVCAFGLLVLIGCAPIQKAKVVERTVITQAQQDERIGGQFVRIVQPGDTLYSIAFSLAMDVNRIAAWNDISDTSKLAVGKKIRLTEPVGFVYPSKKEVKQIAKQVVKREPKDALKPAIKATKPKGSANSSAKKNTSSGLGKTATPTVKPVVPKKSNVQQARPDLTDKLSQNSKWQWPLRGTLVKRFNLAKGQQGIDIQGQRGQTVKATVAGEVVYAGDSLKGYGNLIIIKHSSDYLSAYAHNQTITVSEGQYVKQGQEIAKLGFNLRGAPVSQFQIRRNGNPVDPMLFLK